MKALHGISFVLLVIGGLNWGLVGIGGFMNADYNVVHMILGPVSLALENVVYVLVGLSALVLGISHKRNCRACSTVGMP